MSGRHETMELRAGASGHGMAVPGRILRLLATTLGIPAEGVGLIEPIERGRVKVDISVEQSRRISTPQTLVLLENGKTSLWELRRATDPLSEGTQTWLLTSEGASTPSPGMLASALQETFGDWFGSEELGACFAGANWVRLEIPDRLLAYSQAPPTLRLGKRTWKVEVVA